MSRVIGKTETRAGRKVDAWNYFVDLNCFVVRGSSLPPRNEILNPSSHTYHMQLESLLSQHNPSYDKSR